MGSMSSFLTSAVASQVPRPQPAYMPQPQPYSNIPLPTQSYGYMPMSGSSAGYYGSQPQPLFGSPYSSGYQSSFYNPYAGGNYYQPQPARAPGFKGGIAPPTNMPVVNAPSGPPPASTMPVRDDLVGPYLGQLTPASAAVLPPDYAPTTGPVDKSLSPPPSATPGAKAPPVLF